ncbi:hypothetical protein ACG9Z8_09825 [Acinetobacter ursingii]|uniref:hypothetical protein n=1 Tax=Acinetobacter ursingii TaxID=108980 RepID=UPI003009A202
MKYSIFIPLTLVICTYANADISSFFLDIQQMDRYGVQQRINTLNKICKDKEEHTLVILHALDKNLNLNNKQLDQVQPYYSCFNKIFFSVESKKWIGHQGDWKDSKYYNGIQDKFFIKENIEYSLKNANKIIKKYPNLAFGWYIHYEANLNYLVNDNIKDSYENYLKSLSESLYEIKKTNILWSPTFWTPYNNIPDKNKLVSNLHDLFKNTPRINWIHFQDFLGQSSYTTCNTLTCDQKNHIFNKNFSNQEEACKNTVNYYLLLKAATKNTQIKNIKVNMDLYITREEKKHTYLPAPKNIILNRVKCYQANNLPIGVSSEMLYWNNENK